MLQHEKIYNKITRLSRIEDTEKKYTMRKTGWFKIAKRKWLEYNLYSFSIRQWGTFGFDEYTERYDKKSNYDYHSPKKDWYHDLKNENTFSDRYLFAQKLGNMKGFMFEAKMKSSVPHLN